MLLPGIPEKKDIVEVREEVARDLDEGREAVGNSHLKQKVCNGKSTEAFYVDCWEVDEK